MANRVLFLFKLWFAAHLRRLRFDLAKEITVFLCAAIFAALGLYLASDFLNTKLSEISKEHQTQLLKLASYLTAAGCWFICAKTIAQEKINENSILNAARGMNENPQTLAIYQWAVGVALCAFTALVSTYFANKIFYPWSSEKTLLINSIGVGGTFFYLLTASKRPAPTKQKKYIGIMSNSMVSWRLTQILFRNRITKICVAASTFGIAATVLAANFGAHDLLINLYSFISGCFLAMAIAFQCSEDMKQSWFEKQLGVSHGNYLQTLVLESVILGAGFAAFQFLGFAGLYLTRIPAGLIKAPISIMIPVLMMPFLVLQIDPRRPSIQAMTVVLLGLIVATAWYAHWLGFILIPLFAHFASQQCEGRYYRA